MLLERETELATIAAIAATGARLLAVEGPPGIGKTRLLAEGIAAATAAGVHVARARGQELEADLAWGGCVQLLETALDGCDDELRAALLTGPGAPAAALLDGRGAATPEVDLPVLHAVAWVLGGAARGGRLLIAVDDAHWLDASSLRAAHFLAGRLDRLSAGLVVARRPSEPSSVAELLDALVAQAELITPRPLRDGAVATLVRAALGETTTDAVCAACARASGGNPLYVQQMLSELETDGPALDPARVDALAPVPLARQVVVRLRRLGAGAVALARSAALMADGAPLALAAVVAGLDLEEAVLAAGVLARADLLEDRIPLRFVHPLVRRAIEQDRPAVERGHEHQRVARLLHDTGAAPEAVAAQLLLATPGAGAWAVQALRTAAARALAQAAPASAIAYLERALAETLDEDERAEVLIALGDAESAAGRPPGAALREAVVALRDPARRARALGALGWGLHRAGHFDAAVEAFDEARALAEEADLAAELQFGGMAAGLLSPRHTAAVHAEARGLLEHPPASLTPTARAVLSTVLTQQLYVGDPHAPIRAGAVRLDVERVIAEETADSHVVWHLIGLLSWTDAPEIEPALEAAFADAGRRASVLAFAMASYARSWPRLWAGRLDEAAADAQAAVDAWAGGMEMYLPAATYWGVRAHVERDDLDAAAAMLAAAEPAERWPDAMRAFLLAARGRLAAGAGDHHAALAAELACGETLVGFNAVNPSILPWRSEAALATLALGDTEQAQALAAEELALAERFGAPRALGVALRTHALATGAFAELERAAALLDAGSTRLEHVRTLVELGAALRREGQRVRAREPLREALDVAHALGARRLEARAREELLAAGARPRRAERSGPDALTPSERRVAVQAADGLSNREIAARLFITVSTVEWHLRQTFLKLDIGSRRDLAGALGLSSSG